MSRYHYNKTTHELEPIAGYGSRVATSIDGKTLTIHSSILNIDGYNYGEGDITAAVQMMATIESGMTATKNYTAGECFVYNAILYVVTEDVSEDDEFVIGENCELAPNLSEQILATSDQLTVNNTSFYFDSHDGKYGYNTSAARGADTFVPFKSGVNIIDLGTLSYSYTGATTFTKDITSYTNDYGELTVDNFFPREIGHYLASDEYYYPSFTRSYDATTGVITYSVKGAEKRGTAATAGSFHVYLIF